MSVVVPPKSAARDTCGGGALTEPAGVFHLQWTCGSIPPGITIWPVASMTAWLSPSSHVPGGLTATIFLPELPISQVSTPSHVTTPSPRITKSSIAAHRFLLARRVHAFDQRRSASAAASGANAEIELRDDEESGDADDRRADRAMVEDREISARENERAAKVLLDERAEDVAEHDRSKWKFEIEQDRAEQTEHRDLHNVEHAVLGAVHADGDKEERARKHVAVGNLQQFDPHADQRHVEENEQYVPHPKACDQSPKKVGVLAHELGTGLNSLNEQRSQNERHDRVSRNAKAHGRDEIHLRLGVRRRLRARHALERSLPEPLGRFGYLSLDRVGDERGDGRSSSGHRAEERTDRRAAQHRHERLLAFGPAGLHVAQPHLHTAPDPRRDVHIGQKVGHGEKTQC